MVKLGLYVKLDVKPGKEQEVEQFLKDGLTIVEEEPETIAWFAMRMGPSTFGIFDTFNDESGRQAHLSGKVAAALMARSPDSFSNPPKIEKIDIIASKLSS